MDNDSTQSSLHLLFLQLQRLMRESIFVTSRAKFLTWYMLGKTKSVKSAKVGRILNMFDISITVGDFVSCLKLMISSQILFWQTLTHFYSNLRPDST